MKVHHLNCGTMAFGFVDHCLLVETPDSGLVLVDTGFGLSCIRNPRMLGWTRVVVGPALLEHETAIRQIEALGYAATDVQHILLTHLDYDHTGGLSDFPWATVHVHGPEYRASQQPTIVDRIRYRTEQLCGHGVNWQINDLDDGEPWFGFDAVRDIPGLPTEILVVPLYGHTRGHVGIAIDSGDRWLLHAGDAYAEPHAIGAGPVSVVSRAMHVLTAHPSDPRAQLRNMHRLTELVTDRAEAVTVFCSHDRAAFGRLAAQISG